MNHWSAYDRWEARSRMDQATRDLVREGAIRSAKAVLPYVFTELDVPDALLEVGAGEGHWSAEALRLGVPEVHALDVEPHHDYGVEVYPWDAYSETLPLWRGEKRWPLTICLEMAEHVSVDAGIQLVSELCRVSERVLFSAAIPHQGGDGHLNEQWPAWWAGVFAECGWVLTDPYRQELWQMSMPSDEHIEPWYAQNTLLARPEEYQGEAESCIPMPMVHPAFYASRVSERDACRDLAGLR